MPYKATNKQLAALAKLGLADRALSELRAACRRESLCVDAWDVLVWAAIRLADFERSGKKAITTGRQQIDSFIAVEKAALALRDAIQRLSADDRMRLTGAGAARRVAGALAASSRQALAKLDAEGVTGLGRKRTRCAYAGHIAALAHQLMPYQLTPGDNGPFRRLCDAVFSVAGVYATSQGAIKYFIDNMRPALKKDGLCL